MDNLSLNLEDFKGSNVEKSFLNNDLEKGKKMPIGTVSNGYKKMAEGKWVPVAEGKDGYSKDKPSGYSDAMAEKKLRSDTAMEDHKKPTAEDKEYFKENKAAIVAILEDDLFISIGDAIDKHRSESKDSKGPGKESNTLSKDQKKMIQDYNNSSPEEKMRSLKWGLAAANMMKDGEKDTGFDGIQRDKAGTVYHINEEMEKLKSGKK